MAVPVLINSYVVFSSVCDLLHQFIYAADSLIRTAHLDKAKSTAATEVNAIIAKLTVLYAFFTIYASSALVSFSHSICFRAPIYEL